MKRKSIVALFGRATSKFFNNVGSVKAYAEESNGGEGDANVNDNDDGGDGGEQNRPVINYEDLISKARADEKRKQYKKIERLEADVKEKTEKLNAALLQIGTLETEKEAAEKKLTEAKSGDPEEVKTLKAEVEKLRAELDEANKKLKAFEDVPPVDREKVVEEVREELEKEYEIKTYRMEQLAPYANDPTVIADLVIGDTKEDIDASLKAALDRSKNIKSSLGLTNSGQPDRRRTPNSPNNPAANGGGDTQDILKQLAELDPHSDEYAELRRKAGF